MAYTKRQKSSIFGLEDSLSTLASDISSEASRAIAQENTLDGKITSEVSRATAAEGVLDGKIATEASRAQGAEGTLQSNIDTEATRAQGAEGTLQSNIDAEATRAQGAETTLQSNIDAEATRATAAEGVLDGKITTEKTRAEGAEATLQSNIDAEVSRATAAEQGIQDQVDVINADSSTAGSFRKAIADVVGAAPEALDTLKEIADALANDPQLDSTLRALISSSITAAKDELKGAVSESFDTLKELEDGLTAEITRASQAETDLGVSILAEETRATGAEATITTDLAAEVTRAAGEEARIEGEALKKADNLAALADKAVSRTNLSVYSKAEVDSAIGGQSTKTMNATGVIASDKVTFSKAPIGGTDGVAYASVRVFGVVAGNSEVYDEVQISIDSSDTSGKTFVINGDSAGIYDGKTCLAFIAYNPAI